METMYTLSLISVAAADSASDLSRLQSCELGSSQNCLSFKLEAGEKTGGEGGERGRQREQA